MFVKWCLENVHTVGTTLKGHYNSGTHTTDEKGWYGLWEFWYNPGGIANLLSIPALEASGYTIDYKTKRGTWLVTSSEGGKLPSDLMSKIV